MGKSTLLNSIIGEKVAIVSKKPQTTRNRITGIHTVGEEQFVFLDTPGLHKPRTKLGDFMVKTTNDTIGGTDGVILVVEARESVGDIEAEIINGIKAKGVGAILVNNSRTAFDGVVSVRKGWNVVGSTTDDAALAVWDGGNRLKLSGNAGILLVLERK